MSVTGYQETVLDLSDNIKNIYLIIVSLIEEFESVDFKSRELTYAMFQN